MITEAEEEVILSIFIVCYTFSVRTCSYISFQKNWRGLSGSERQDVLQHTEFTLPSITAQEVFEMMKSVVQDESEGLLFDSLQAEIHTFLDKKLIDLMAKTKKKTSVHIPGTAVIGGPDRVLKQTLSNTSIAKTKTREFSFSTSLRNTSASQPRDISAEVEAAVHEKMKKNSQWDSFSGMNLRKERGYG